MAVANNSYDNILAGEFPVVTDRVTIASGANLKKGTILGIVTASGKYKAADSSDNSTGIGTPIAILLEDAAAASADKANVLVALTGEFNSAELVAKTGSTIAGFKGDLRKVGIFVKSNV